MAQVLTAEEDLAAVIRVLPLVNVRLSKKMTCYKHRQFNAPFCQLVVLLYNTEFNGNST